MKRYNKRNCQSCVRGSFKDIWGRRVVIMGTHAFEYSIFITEDFMSTTVVESFSCGADARRRFNELKRKR